LGGDGIGKRCRKRRWKETIKQMYSLCGTLWHTCRNQNSSFPETDESI